MIKTHLNNLNCTKIHIDLFNITANIFFKSSKRRTKDELNLFKILIA